MQIERLEQRQLLTILYWDPNGTSGGLGGSGTWVANNWSTQSPPQTGSTGQPWANGDIAVFAGTSGGTVNIASTAVNAAAIEFSTGGYTISANSNTPLTLPSGTTTPITVPTGQNETISAVISGGGNMALSGGGGTLVLTAANTYTGSTTINSGTLQLGNGSFTGSLSAGATIYDNSTLALSPGSSGLVMPGTTTISGGGSLVISGGTVTISGSTSCSGSTTINTGATLQLGNSSSTFTFGSGYIVDNGNLVLSPGSSGAHSC